MSEEKDEVIGPKRKVLDARVIDPPDDPPPEQKKKEKKKE